MGDNLREELLRVKARESRYKKEAEAKIASLEKRAASLEAELASAKEKGGASAIESQKTIAELTASLEKARGDLDAATALIKAREKEFADAAEKGNKYKATVVARIATLEGELENARGEIGRLKSSLEAAKKDQAISAKFISKELSPLKSRLLNALDEVSGWNETFNNLPEEFSTFFMMSLNRDAIDAFCSRVNRKEALLRAINSDRRRYDSILQGGEIVRASEEAIADIQSILKKLRELRNLNGSYREAFNAAKTFLLARTASIAKLKKELESTPDNRL